MFSLTLVIGHGSRPSYVWDLWTVISKSGVKYFYNFTLVYFISLLTPNSVVTHQLRYNVTYPYSTLYIIKFKSKYQKKKIKSPMLKKDPTFVGVSGSIRNIRGSWLGAPRRTYLVDGRTGVLSFQLNQNDVCVMLSKKIRRYNQDYYTVSDTSSVTPFYDCRLTDRLFTNYRRDALFLQLMTTDSIDSPCTMCGYNG